MAVYVEKKVSSEPSSCCLLARREDSSIHASGATRHGADDYIIKGGITARSLRNFSKHYLAMVAAQMLLAAVFGTCAIPNRLLQQICPGAKACLHHCSMTL
jgi:hypothetical protein